MGEQRRGSVPSCEHMSAGAPLMVYDSKNHDILRVWAIERTTHLEKSSCGPADYHAIL